MPEASTILVTDDEKVIRDGCTRILQPEGYRVVTAEHGLGALEVMDAEPVDVVLCDLKMPVMDALEFMRKAEERHPDVPVVIITGHGTVADAVECMKRGAFDFVTKPFRIDHLLLVVRRALEKRRLELQTKRLEKERARNLYDLATEQSRLHAIIHCMADGVLVTNRDLEVVLCNPSLTRLLNLSQPVDAPRRLDDLGCDGSLKESLASLLATAEENPEKSISQELKRGRLHLRALSAPFFGPDRQVLGTVTVVHDITRFKELDEMKSNFVHMVSHELRAPLTAIKMQHTVILDGLAGELTEKQRELLQRAHDKIDGLLELINDSLDVARIEAGHNHMEQIPLALPEVLAETVELLRPRAEEQGVELTLEAPPDLPLVQADRRGMEEVFTNLIANAINYSPDGGEVSVSAVSHGDYVEIRVTDSGIGIEPEEIPKIFDKFYRVKHPKTRQVIGTGLGLAIVKGIVEAHRGSVEVESEVGVGSTFRVLLPAATAEKRFPGGEA